MTPSDQSIAFTDPDRARADLREGIENSREMLRQSRMLLELSESDGVVGDDRGLEHPATN